MRARRRERENPVIGGIDLPDDVWVALDLIQQRGDASREQMDELWALLLDPDKDRWRVLVLWANDLLTRRDASTRAVRWASIEALLDLAHEHYDGLTEARLAELRRGHGRPLSATWFSGMRTVAAAARVRGPSDATVRSAIRTTVLALRRYPMHPDVADDLLVLVNDLIGGHRVEAVRGEGAFVSHYFRDIIALYVNMGDAYAPTVLYDTDFHRFMITSWGDFLEQWEREHRDDEEDT